MALAASKFLNLDDSGESLSVVVRIYQLSEKDRLEGADFSILWKSDQEILKEHLLDRKEITLQPDSRQVVKIEPKEEAKYLAVMALFRRPQGVTWRQIVPLNKKKVRFVELTVHERTVKLAYTQ